MTLSVENMSNMLIEFGKNAKKAAQALAVLSADAKKNCLILMAKRIQEATEEIKKQNAIDLENGKQNGLSSAMLDRLTLNDSRIKEMAQGLITVAEQEDPVGKSLSKVNRPNGLEIEKISVPLGVIGIIYESRPNVTVDAAGICLKAGNAVILRGGSEAINSNKILADILNKTAIECNLPNGTVQLIPWVDREAVKLMLKMDKYIDLIIPRGGESLIRVVCQEATMPVLKHYKGVCHLYIDEDCDFESALNIVVNSKCQRPSACNALETLLINRNAIEKFVPMFKAKMDELNVKRYGSEEYCQLDNSALLANEDNFGTEYLELTMNVNIVKSVEEAVDHINFYGSKHSDGVLTNNNVVASYFCANVDSSTIYWNASTRFTDGGEFGMGAEIGISTDKMHARGPMGADELTSYKYLVRGSGQIRE